jgi:lambda family phage tail tape measure protein
MASLRLGALTIDLIAKIGGFVSGMTEAEREADKKSREIARKMKAQTASIEKSWSGIGKAISVGISGITIGSVIQKVIENTKEAENAQAQLAAVLTSTGQSAGWSRDKLNEMASAMSNSSVFSKDEIVASMSRFLAYSGIVGDQVPRAMQAVIDMSARMRYDLSQSAEIVGRALDIPSQGLSSLSRQGFRFTEDQKALVKQLEETGRVAEAQNIVLSAMVSSYGGAAAAARNTFGGAVQVLKNQLNDLLTGGSGSFDSVAKSINQLTQTLASPETQAAFSKLIGWIVQLINALANAFTVINILARSKEALNVFLGTDSVSKAQEGLDHYLLAMKLLTKQYVELSNEIKKNPLDKGLADRLEFVKSRMNATQEKIDERANILKNPYGMTQSAPTVQAPTLASPILPSAKGAANNDKLKKESLRLGKQQAMQAKQYLQNLRDQAEQVKEMTALQRVDYDILTGKIKLSKHDYTKAVALAQRADDVKQAEQAKKYVDALKDRLVSTGEISEREKVLSDVLRGNVGLYGEQLEKALALAGAIDKVREAEKLRQDEIDAMNRKFALQNDLFAKMQGYQSQLASFGMGNRESSDLQAQIQIQQQSAQEILRLDQTRQALLVSAQNDNERSRINNNYAQQLTDLKNNLEQQLLLHKDFIEQRKKLEATGSLGVQSAIRSYVESATDMYSQAASATENLMRGMEDALVSFVQNGKIDFRSLANSILVDIARIQARQIIYQFATASSGWIGSIFKFFGFANGGYTGDGDKYAPAGVVHRGEYVINKDATNHVGIDFLDRINRSYATGGYVGVPPSSYQTSIEKIQQDRSSGQFVNVIEDASKAGKIEQTTNERGEEVMNIFVANIRRGGKAARAFESAYGLTRVGR